MVSQRDLRKKKNWPKNHAYYWPKVKAIVDQYCRDNKEGSHKDFMSLDHEIDGLKLKYLYSKYKPDGYLWPLMTKGKKAAILAASKGIQDKFKKNKTKKIEHPLAFFEVPDDEPKPKPKPKPKPEHEPEHDNNSEKIKAIMNLAQMIKDM